MMGKVKSDNIAKGDSSSTTTKQQTSTAGNTSSSSSSPSDSILKYLKLSNRPYNATDVFNNMKKVHTQAVVKKTLSDLAMANLIKEKTYSKQKIYVCTQDENDVASPEQLNELDSQATSLSKTLQEHKDELVGLSAQLGQYDTALTNEELDKQLTEMSTEIASMESKLTEIKTGEQHISPEERDRIFSSYATAVKVWKQRKTTSKNIIDDIACGWDKSMTALYEELGVSTDEEVGITLSEFTALL